MMHSWVTPLTCSDCRQHVHHGLGQALPLAQCALQAVVHCEVHLCAGATGAELPALVSADLNIVQVCGQVGPLCAAAAEGQCVALPVKPLR